MAEQWQIRKGTSTANDSFIGAEGELTMDTTNKTVRIHDGVTRGGITLAKQEALENIDYVIEWQNPTSENNYTWYRKYQSGWVEQGGTSPSIAVNTSITISLLITMANTHYQITQSSTANYETIVTNMNGWGVGSKSTTSFVMWNRTGTTNQFDWVVCGIAA